MRKYKYNNAWLPCNNVDEFFTKDASVDIICRLGLKNAPDSNCKRIAMKEDKEDYNPECFFLECVAGKNESDGDILTSSWLLFYVKEDGTYIDFGYAEDVPDDAWDYFEKHICVDSDGKRTTTDYSYEYRFVNFRDGSFHGKHVNGISILLHIFPVNNKKDSYTFLEPQLPMAKERGTNIHLPDSYSIEISPEHLYVIKRNDDIIKKFCNYYGWDDVSSEVMAYFMDFPDSDESVKVSKEEFESFLHTNINGFHKPANKIAHIVAKEVSVNIVFENVEIS